MRPELYWEGGGSRQEAEGRSGTTNRSAMYNVSLLVARIKLKAAHMVVQRAQWPSVPCLSQRPASGRLVFELQASGLRLAC